MAETRVGFLDLRAQYALIADEVRAAVDEVFAAQSFVLGPALQGFEEDLARYLDAAAVVGVASGTDALYLALRAAGIGPGDAVVTSPFTFVSTATAIARAGARPYFVDIDAESFNLDPRGLATWLERTCRRDGDVLRTRSGEAVRAVIPVHLFGRPCAMSEIAAVAAAHGLVVIEDAAQSAGARVDGRGRLTGTVGRFGCFSFYPTKNLGGAGDGGAVACADAADAVTVRSIARHGTLDGAAYRHVELGLASRLDALQAVVLRIKLRHLDAWNAARRRAAERYGRLFERTLGTPSRRREERPLVTPAVVPGHVFHQYVVRVPVRDESRPPARDAVRALLADDGIETQVYYPIPVHLQPCFAGLGYRAGDFPEAERACDEALALPLYPELGDDAAEAVVAGVAGALRACRAVSTARELVLAYGSGRVRVALPPGRFTAITASPPAPGADVSAMLRQALEHPIDAPPLCALVRAGDRVTIVVSDGTRVTGARELLPALLGYLDAAGIPTERVRILFALGMHRRQTVAEQAAIIGGDVAERVEHLDHDCDDGGVMTAVESGDAGHALRLNRLVLDGSLVIATGAIAFHYLAGFGGGRKAILPGVAARDSVRDFHRRSLDPGPGGGRHPCVAPGVRAGNPMDQLASAVAARLPRVFLLNTIMADGIAAIFAGDLVAAFDHGCERYREWFSVPIAARRPVVIVSAGGAPRDCDLVQAQKAIAAGAAALAPGGRMLVLAACADGMGNAELRSWFDQPDRASHVAALRARFSVPGQTALALREHAERFRISLCSELPPDVVARTGMTPIAHPDDFAAAVARDYGSDVEGYVLPGGGRYLPVVETAA